MLDLLKKKFDGFPAEFFLNKCSNVKSSLVTEIDSRLKNRGSSINVEVKKTYDGSDSSQGCPSSLTDLTWEESCPAALALQIT